MKHLSCCLLFLLSLSFSTLLHAAVPGLDVELRHERGVGHVEFDSTQRYALTVEHRTLHVWDMQSGKELWRKQGDINGIAMFSPDGEFVYSVAHRVIRRWQTADGALVHEYAAHASSIRHIALSSDGSLLFSAGEEGDAKIWLTASGETLLELRSGGDPQHTFDWADGGFSADNRYLLVRDKAGIRLHDVATGKVQVEVKKARAAAFLSNKEILVASGANLDVYNVDSGKLVRDIRNEEWLRTMSISVHAESKAVLLTDASSAVLIDTESGSVKQKLLPSDANFLNFAKLALISPDGKHVAAAFASGEVQLWTQGDAKPRSINVHKEPVEDLAFSPDGKYLLSGSEDTTARLWDVATGQPPVAAAPTEIIVRPKLPRLVTRQGHSDSLQVYTVTRDGQHLVSGGNDSQVRVWHIATGREVRTFSVHAAEVTALAVSHNNQWLASADDKGFVYVHDLDTGEQLQRIASGSKVTDLLFLPGDEELVVAQAASYGTGGSADVYRVDTGEKRATIGDLWGKGARRLLLAPDQRHLAIVSKDTTLLFELGKLDAPLTSFKGPHSNYLVAGCFTPDGKRLAVADYDSNVVVFDVPSGKALRHWKAHKYATQAMLARDNKTFLSASYYEIRHWNIATGKQLQEFKGGEVSRGTIALLPGAEKNLLLAGHEHGAITHANLQTGKVEREWQTLGLAGAINSVEFSADGKRILIAGEGYEDQNLVQLWDLETGKEIQRITGRPVPDYDPNRGPTTDGPEYVLKAQASFLPDNRVMIWNNRYARVHDLNTGKETLLVDDKSYRLYLGVSNIAVSPDGNNVLFTDQAFPQQWDVNAGKRVRDVFWKLQKAPFMPRVYDFAFSPDGTKIIATSNSQLRFTLLDAGSGKVLREFGKDAPLATRLVFSPDGKTLYSGNQRDGDITIWDVASGEQVASLSGHIAPVKHLVFHPDGQRLLTASADGTVRLWDTVARRELQRFDAQSQAVNSVAFSPDGKRFVSGHADGATVLWDLGKPDWQAKLYSFRDGNWVVATAQGRYDTNSPGDLPGVSWVVDDKPRTPLPVEIFIRELYEPRLLPRLLADARFRPIRRIRDINRVQPEVRIVDIKANRKDPSRVDVRVAVKSTTETYAQQGKTIKRVSGARDLRLFRDGQLVAYAFEHKAEDKPRQDSQTLTLQGIRLPSNKAGKAVTFTAYAFNDDGIKSATARQDYSVPASLAKRPARAYVISIGMNSYENPAWDLRYAANDANAMQNSVATSLQATGKYSEVVTIPLISDTSSEGPKVTQQLLLGVFDLLAGREVPAAVREQIPAAATIKPAHPEDLVFVSYSGHGYAHWDGRFFMFPYDIGNDGQRELSAATLEKLLSSDTLANHMRDIDAGEFIMIIDACNSAASVQGERFKPGPMGSRGLGQLAYNKGMRVLTASQAESLALESDLIRHGLLSYVLLKEGVEGQRADYLPVDNKVVVPEWLRYGQKRVPEMFVDLVNQTFTPQGRGAAGFRVASEADIAQALQDVQLPGLFDFARDGSDTLLFRVTGTGQ